MKKILSIAVVSVLLLSGVAVALQSEEQANDSGMHGMKDRTKNEKQGMDRDSMMRMMKMMDQCSAMMESAPADSGAGKESNK